MALPRHTRLYSDRGRLTRVFCVLSLSLSLGRVHGGVQASSTHRARPQTSQELHLPPRASPRPPLDHSVDLALAPHPPQHKNQRPAAAPAQPSSVPPSVAEHNNTSRTDSFRTRPGKKKRNDKKETKKEKRKRKKTCSALF
jgi:hypothetical protein